MISVSLTRVAERRSLDVQTGVALLWTVGALAVLLLTSFVLEATTPIFQVLWLVVPLVSLVRFRDAERVGIRRIGFGRLLRWTVVAGIAYGLLLLFVEPWAGVYDRLLELAVDGPDPTFTWLVRFDGAVAWLGLALFSGFVTLYSEELFFRGWVLQTLERRTRPSVAVGVQAVLFTLFQSIPVFFFSQERALLYPLVYAFGLGLILGTAAHVTESIWPGLIVATAANLVLTALLF
ncbi:CPBP family intramembrane glutamic endopeptidase [Haladaptatus sp. NG-WS-4]